MSASAMYPCMDMAIHHHWEPDSLDRVTYDPICGDGNIQLTSFFIAMVPSPILVLVVPHPFVKRGQEIQSSLRYLYQLSLRKDLHRD